MNNAPAPTLETPAARRWRRFRRNRRGMVSLVIFLFLFGLSLFAEILSNDKPFLVHYQGRFFCPILFSYPETDFGGDFATETDYRDPFFLGQMQKPGNYAIYPPNPHSYQSIDRQLAGPFPSPPSRDNWLGTDDRGRDVLARLLYGFRLSVLFGLALTLAGTLFGIFMGAIQGYFGGRLDLFLQRGSEIWGSMPELYLLIIFSSIFQPSALLLLLVLSLFSWMGLADYVRAEFLRGRNLEYVTAAKALGVGNWTIMYRHLLPNGLTPVVTFLPFRISSSILALTSLDFLGLGVPPTSPSLGELLAQGKANLDAWWLSLSSFLVVTVTLILLIFIGEALREAFDPRLD
jgi:microcin C transport system permease protein